MSDRSRARGYSVRELKGTEDVLFLKIIGTIIGGVMLAVVLLFLILWLTYVLVRTDVLVHDLDLPAIERQQHETRESINHNVWRRICLDGQNWEPMKQECV